MPIGLRGGEEPGARGWEPNQRAAAGGGAGAGRGDCAEARPPGKPRAVVYRGRWRGGWGPEPGRGRAIATPDPDLACDSPLRGKRRMAGPRRIPRAFKGAGRVTIGLGAGSEDASGGVSQLNAWR